MTSSLLFGSVTLTRHRTIKGEMLLSNEEK